MYLQFLGGSLDFYVREGRAKASRGCLLGGGR